MAVTLFGAGMGPVSGVIPTIEDGKLPTSVAGVRVLFNGLPAPLLFVREDQINALVPFTTASPSRSNPRRVRRPHDRPIYGQCQDRGSRHFPDREHGIRSDSESGQ